MIQKDTAVILKKNKKMKEKKEPCCKETLDSSV